MNFEELNKVAKEAVAIVRESYTTSKESRKTIGKMLKARKGTFMIPAKIARELFGVPDDSKATIKSVISHADAEAKDSFFKVGRRIIEVKQPDGKMEEQVWAVITKREPKKAKAKDAAKKGPAEEKPSDDSVPKPSDADPQPATPSPPDASTEEKPSVVEESPSPVPDPSHEIPS